MNNPNQPKGKPVPPQANKPGFPGQNKPGTPGQPGTQFGQTPQYQNPQHQNPQHPQHGKPGSTPPRPFQAPPPKKP